MEPLGSHYAVLLHNERLQHTLLPEPGRPRSSRRRSSHGSRMRVLLAQTLHGLADRLDASAGRRREVGAQPASVH
jgi:hypothetical protein